MNSMNYAALSNKNIIELDDYLYDKHYKSLNQPNTEITYEQIACMIPGDIHTLDSGRFLLEKQTGGALKLILRDIVDNIRNFHLGKYKGYKGIMIVHQSLNPMIFPRLNGGMLIYDKQANLKYKQIGNYKDVIYPTRHILKKGHGDIQHHEYFLLLHNDARILNAMDEIEPLLKCLIEHSTRHYIYVNVQHRNIGVGSAAAAATPPLLTDTISCNETCTAPPICEPTDQAYISDIDDRILEAYLQCLIVINVVVAIYYATIILV